MVVKSSEVTIFPQFVVDPFDTKNGSIKVPSAGRKPVMYDVPANVKSLLAVMCPPKALPPVTDKPVLTTHDPDMVTLDPAVISPQCVDPPVTTRAVLTRADPDITMFWPAVMVFQSADPPVTVRPLLTVEVPETNNVLFSLTAFALVTSV